jgi:sortase A
MQPYNQEMGETPSAFGEPVGRRRRTSVVGVFGEIFITFGIVILLYLGWALWLNDAIFGASQGQVASSLSDQWQTDFDAGAPTPTSEPTAAADDPVVMAVPETNAPFATLIVPRLAADYQRPIAQGTGTKVLNNAKLGMGHYAQSQMPGEIGNFALASHRSAYGGAFHIINQLVVGDPIFVETPDGWYEYLYRNTEFVRPSGVGVILPVPQENGLKPTERLITLTTCNPLYSSAERMVAYGVFEKWYPRADGPPPEIAALVGTAHG